MSTVVVLAVVAVLRVALPLAIAADRRQIADDRREISRLAALVASRVDTTRMATRPLPRWLERGCAPRHRRERACQSPS
jgi:hypothetical protein